MPFVITHTQGMDHARIEKGELVRLRIVGTRVDAKEIVCLQLLMT